MPNEFRAGESSISHRKFAIVVSEYNVMVTSKLHEAAVQTLLDQGVEDGNIDVFWVPGAWEIPLLARHLCLQKKYSAIIGLGCVIRGETTHDQHINREISHGLAQLGHEFNLPVSMGVLTCNNLQQAEARAGGNRGNKGVEATQAAIDMVRLIDQLQPE